MTARGLLFTPENYTKSENGSKVQTRRIITAKHLKYPKTVAVEKVLNSGNAFDAIRLCPYGQPGDRLYVKESHYRYGRWVRSGKTKKTGKQRWRFKASALFDFVHYNSSNIPPEEIGHKRSFPRNLWWKRSPLFMEKRFARLWLELTGVRVERLQEISAEDCLAEGVDCNCLDGGFDDGVAFGNYIKLWESINGQGSWNLNPWVWVLEYRKDTP